MAASLRVAMSMNSAGTPLAHQLVGMIVVTSLRYCALISALLADGAEAQDVVGIVRSVTKRARKKRNSLSAKPNRVGHVVQECVLPGVQGAIGGGDVAEDPPAHAAAACGRP